ncbi:sensor histidine kinase [Sediminibacterium sp. TEGAF015]|uniref:sensor histidine kinase n=1 Tax=Sediminibacterium sp. TEGAF015 TaxID=575378 RepID=UPI002209DC73|nr:PAS domain-containing sensor histidine kinase [Sediminibacterium sp. TEGAF015]BDQ13208.1 PAS domain-containing sensor histidine kinase [Sediminibacterium sp. TEGAF015]
MFVENRFKYLKWLGVILMSLAGLVLVGWEFNITVLKSFSVEMTAMNPLTAITFIVAGWWLCSYKENNSKNTLAIAAIFILIVGLVHSAAYLFLLDSIRFDDLLFRQKVESSYINSHLAPTTAVLFLLSGIIMLSNSSKIPVLLKLRNLLSLLIFIVSYASILGYLYGRDSAYRVEGISTIALSTAILFLLVSIGLFLSNIKHGLPKLFVSILEGSSLFRKVTLFMLVFPPFLGYLRILGEKRGLYSHEYGSELFTMILTFIVFILIYNYAHLLNNKQKTSIALEKQLKQSERKFRELVSSLKEGVASIDYEGRLIYCNPSYCKILGYKEKELIGNVVVDMIIPIERRKEFYERLERRKKGISENYQTEIIRKDGEKIIIDIKSNSLIDDQGSTVAYVVSINDITEEIRQLEDIKAFSSSAAHDLNNPINKIMTVVDLVDPQTLNEENREFLQMVKATVSNMKVLTQDLLTFSRLGKQPLEKAEVHLQILVEEVIKQQKPLDFKGTVQLNTLPNALGNEAALKQLFNNLLSNAFKYSSKKENPAIEIGSYQKEHQTFYYVKDNGVGLNQEQMKTLFTPFKRYHSKFEGNGLGLAIVKRIIDKHGGTIFAESDTDKGLTFHFTLSHN